MILVVKKTNSSELNNYTIRTAQGKIVRNEVEETHYLEELGQIGNIFLSDFQIGKMQTGQIITENFSGRTEFYSASIENEDGKMRRSRIGKCFQNENLEYVIEEKFHVKKSFWIFRTGYEYFVLYDKFNLKKYKIYNITFASDMHYYYVYDEAEHLVAVVYKPYKKAGYDEYHVYTKTNDLINGILFLALYIDAFFYPYSSSVQYDIGDREVYEDDAAYTISDDELLKLYDDSFIKDVILSEE